MMMIMMMDWLHVTLTLAIADVARCPHSSSFFSKSPAFRDRT
jgi:hypothetical protein